MVGSHWDEVMDPKICSHRNSKFGIKIFSQKCNYTVNVQEILAMLYWYMKMTRLTADEQNTGKYTRKSKMGSVM